MNFISCISISFLLFLSKAISALEVGDSDFQKTIPEIIKSRGFETEIHYITTDDGYILTTFRIVNPIAKTNSKQLLKPLVLSHGLIGTGNDFLVTCAGGNVSQQIFDNRFNLGNVDFNTSGGNLGFILSNLGYDIWLPQTRGNYYSENHTIYDPSKDKKFWEFTFDEIALLDTPAIIGYVKDVTKFDQVGWIGHSQGAGIMFALLAERPELSNDIRPIIALAPPVFLTHGSGGIDGIVGSPVSQDILRARGGKCFGTSKYTRSLADFCHGFKLKGICRWLVTNVLNFNLALVDESRVPIYIWNDPSGTSCWNAAHFGQLMSSKKFQKMDFGKKENLERYGSEEPPIYRLENINSTDIVIIHGPNDQTVHLDDIELLKKALKVDLLLDYLIPEKSWSHLDHIFSKKTGELQNSRIAKILSSYQPH